MPSSFVELATQVCNELQKVSHVAFCFLLHTAVAKEHDSLMTMGMKRFSCQAYNQEYHWRIWAHHVYVTCLDKQSKQPAQSNKQLKQAGRAYICVVDIGHTTLAARNCWRRGERAKQLLKLQPNAHQHAILSCWRSHLQPVRLACAVQPNWECQCCMT